MNQLGGRGSKISLYWIVAYQNSVTIFNSMELSVNVFEVLIISTLTVNYLKVAKEQNVLLISTETDKILSHKFHFWASPCHPTYRKTHRNVSLRLIVFVDSDVIRNEDIMMFV